MPLPRNPNAIFLSGVVFSSSLALTMLLVPLYAMHLGYSTLGIGALAAMVPVMNIILRLMLGQLSDQWGETRLIRIGALFYLGGPVALLLSTYAGLPALLAAPIFLGIGNGVFYTVSKVYVTKLPTGQSGQNISRFNGASTLGLLLGNGAAGFLAARAGYPVTFALLWALTIGYSVIAFSLPSLSPAKGGRLDFGALIRFIPRDLDLRALSLAGLCAFVAATPFALTGSFYPVYLARAGYREEAIGILMVLITVGTLGASLWSRYQLDRIQNLVRLAATVTCLTGVGVAVFAFFRGWLPLGLILLATGFVAGISNMVYQMFVRIHSPMERRGTAMAFAGFFWSLALLVIPMGFGLMATWLPLPVAFVALGLLLVAAGGTAGYLMRPGTTRSSQAHAD